MHCRMPLIAGLCVAIACVVLVDAQEGELNWAAGADGAVPDGAIQAGQGADGRSMHICRGAFGGGTQLGRIADGMIGCSIAYRGREVTLKSYEVLIHPARRVAIDRAQPSIMREHAAVDTSRLPRTPYMPTAVPPAPADSSTRRGFDDSGKPYVDVRLPDGTIKRTQDNGVTLIKPDGTTEFIPNKVIRMNAPPPTPPSLPSDPAQGRVWVDRHNADLLDLISRLVQRDDAEMQKFTNGERQAVGDDLFKQIGYRTTIAEFLATQR